MSQELQHHDIYDDIYACVDVKNKVCASEQQQKVKVDALTSFHRDCVVVLACMY